MIIAVLGPEGSYSHEAALVIGNQLLFCKFIGEIFEAVKSEKAEQGIIPLENMLHGAIGESMDHLYSDGLFIQKELQLSITHVLAGKKNFKKIASHSQALSQCQKYLQTLNVEIFETTSTSEAMRLACENPEIAAIGSPVGAKTYGLEILEKEITDQKENVTRFALIAKEESTQGTKTSLALYPPKDRPGLLFDILKVFKDHELNLSRIESRPAKTKMGEYIFYLDVDADWKTIETILPLLTQFRVRHLGTYSIKKL